MCYSDCACQCTTATSCEGIKKGKSCMALDICTWDSTAQSCQAVPVTIPTLTPTTPPWPLPQGSCPAGTTHIPANGRGTRDWACCAKCPGSTPMCYSDCSCQCTSATSCAGLESIKTCTALHNMCTWDSATETCSLVQAPTRMPTIPAWPLPQGSCPSGTTHVPANGRSEQDWGCCSGCPGGTSKCYGDCACQCTAATSCSGMKKQTSCTGIDICTWHHGKCMYSYETDQPTYMPTLPDWPLPRGSCPSGSAQVPANGRATEDWACCNGCYGGSSMCYSDCACKCTTATTCRDIKKSKSCTAIGSCHWNSRQGCMSVSETAIPTSMPTMPHFPLAQGVCSSGGEVPANGRGTREWECCSNCPGGASMCYSDCACRCSFATTCEGLIKERSCTALGDCVWDSDYEACRTKPVTPQPTPKPTNPKWPLPQANCPSGSTLVPANGRGTKNWACCNGCPGGPGMCYSDCACQCSTATTCEGLVKEKSCTALGICFWDSGSMECRNTIPAVVDGTKKVKCRILDELSCLLAAEKCKPAYKKKRNGKKKFKKCKPQKRK